MQNASIFEHDIELPTLKPIQALINRELHKIKGSNTELVQFFRPDLTKKRRRHKRFKEQGCQTTSQRSLQSSMMCSQFIEIEPYPNHIRTSSQASSVRHLKLPRALEIPQLQKTGTMTPLLRKSPMFVSKELKLDSEMRFKGKELTLEKLRCYIGANKRKNWVPA